MWKGFSKIQVVVREVFLDSGNLQGKGSTVKVGVGLWIWWQLRRVVTGGLVVFMGAWEGQG